MVSDYSGSTPEEKWEGFLADLEALPSEFKVIGINDYIFLDGYKKTTEYKKAGRLANIDLILPVIELRLDKFAGTSSNWHRVNYHVLFSDAIKADVIEAQFIAALSRKYSPHPAVGGVEWNQIPTRDSLTELGMKLIEAAPDTERPKYGSPLQEGFNALCIPLDAIHKALEHSCFAGRFITAVGKAEWASMNWNDHSIAEKRTVINGADISFSAASSPSVYQAARQKLANENVEAKLMDCSDAHVNSARSSEKDRVGNCHCWVKAVPTFEGLKLAIREFDDRVYVGDEPPLVARNRKNRTKFIDSVSFTKKPGVVLTERWVDGAKVELNPGLVAIIGNKGSGKSALSDTIGLLGNTPQHQDFSFLSEMKFRDPKTGTKAENFQAELRWASDDTSGPVNLNSNPPDGATELVKYIPQNYLEKICNEVRKLEEGDFDRELKSVIFSHVDSTETLGSSDLDSLIRHTTEASQTARETLVQELKSLNLEIVALEAAGAPRHRAKLQGALDQKKKELDAHDKSKPAQVPEPKADAGAKGEVAALTERLKKLKLELAVREKAIQAASAALELANRKDAAITRLSEKIENFTRTYKSFEEECAADASLLGVTLASFLQIKIDESPLKELRKGIAEDQGARRRELDAAVPSSPAAVRKTLEEEQATLQSQLDEPNRKYQAYLTALKTWSDTRAGIVGDKQSQGSVESLKAAIAGLANIPTGLKAKERERELKVREIHAKIVELADNYRAMFRGVVDFVQGHPLAKTLSIRFTVDVVPMGLEDGFLALVNQKRTGTFCGSDEGKVRLRQLVAPVQFQDEGRVVKFLEDLHSALTHDLRGGAPKETDLQEQLRKGVSPEHVYDYIYSLEYLQPRYVLEWEGKDLAVLSPGERGTLLLAFYLLIDKSDLPLAIDQPEGNLDNETVYRVLVNCLKDAKKRRQVIIVTHNPNLAVVCDADQVIYASIDKQRGSHITYESGAIEDPSINRHILDVLEGTRPAFDNRDDKYEAVTSAVGTSQEGQ